MSDVFERLAAPVMETFAEALDAAYQKVRAKVLSKQHDYGHSNILKGGEPGLVLRENDKMERLWNLVWVPLVEGRGPAEPQNEAIEDTWIDIAGYALIALMLKERLPDGRSSFELPLVPEDNAQDDAVAVAEIVVL